MKMTPEMFLEFWSAAAGYLDRPDKVELAERYVKLYDSYGSLDDLREILGQDADIDWFLQEQLGDDIHSDEDSND